MRRNSLLILATGIVFKLNIMRPPIHLSLHRSTTSFGNQGSIMKLKTMLSLFLLVLPTYAVAQNLALSFDDGFNPSSQPKAMEWNAAILESLSKAGVKSIYYVTGNRVDSPDGLSLVSDWGKNGHLIANHTYSHFNFGSDKRTLESFISDVEKNEALLKDMPGWTKRFRFPYLKEGRTAEKRDGFRVWIANHGYETGAVSIDSSDWYYSSRYVAWLESNAQQDPSAFRDAYLEHLWNRASFYDSLSQRIFNRSTNHVILLHTNAINAAFLTDVIVMFRSKGWNIISPEEAYQDPLYSKMPEVLPAGESILWSFAKQYKLPSLRYPAEDGIYEKPILDALGL